MPSASVLESKQKVVADLTDRLKASTAGVIVKYEGITVEKDTALRAELRKAGVEYSVIKNTLIKRAIEGTEFEPLGQVLDGPSAIAISKEDATAPARVLNEVIKEFKKMEFKAGVVEGQYMDKTGIQAVADIPSRDVLIAKFMGSIQSPVSKAVRTFQAIADAKAEA